MIYLDNAATSFPKPKNVISAANNCIKNYCANSGRSSHRLAEKTAFEIYKAREAVSDFLFSGAPENVIFTENATYALNIAIKTIITEKCHILISDIEHNAVLRPVNMLKKSLGVEYSVFNTDGDIEKNIQSLIKNETYAIVSTLMSNVTGKEIPLSVLSRVAKRNNLMLIVDASQIIGHKRINIKENRCSALCAPAHKGLFGIQGCGFCVFQDVLPKATLIEGGSGYESKNLYMPRLLPEHFEAGTLPSPSVISLRAGIDFLNSYTLEGIENKLFELTLTFKERIECIEGSCIYSEGCGIISFNIQGKALSEIANELTRQDICIRDGLHCAPLAHKKLGTLDTGLIRISLSVFNKKSEADKLYRALKAI